MQVLGGNEREKYSQSEPGEFEGCDADNYCKYYTYLQQLSWVVLVPSILELNVFQSNINERIY